MNKLSILLLSLITLLSLDTFAQCSVVGEAGSLPPTGQIDFTTACEQEVIQVTLPNIANEIDPDNYDGGPNDDFFAPANDPVNFPFVLLFPVFDVYAISPVFGEYYIGSSYSPNFSATAGIIDAVLFNESLLKNPLDVYDTGDKSLK